MSNERRSLTGWGRSITSLSEVAGVRLPADVGSTGGPRGDIARGLGRSYGDAALNSGGRVFVTESLDEISLDSDRGVLRAGAGVSLGTILSASVPKGWFLPVVPGTKHVTLGGALAADIHGKNHHREGSFSEHVTSFRMVTANGDMRTVDRADTNTFCATAGGMGLTGVITEATIQLRPIETPLVAVDTKRTADIDELMAEMEATDDTYRYSVAWVDLLARGASMGRGVLTQADHAPRDAVTAQLPDNGRRTREIEVPDLVPSGALNRASVAAFNRAWYARAPVRRIGELQHLDRFFFPLDMIRDWNRLYGRRGFIQYQLAVPPGGEGTVVKVVDALASRRVPSFLAILKRFGGGTGLLSFPIEGWTLSVDVPLGVAGLRQLLDTFDQWVIEAGGRGYLAKDSRMRPDVFRAMYPEFDRWDAIRRELDPECRWRSDLARRLDIGR